MSSADLGVDAALAAIRAADGEGALRSGIEQALQAVRLSQPEKRLEQYPHGSEIARGIAENKTGLGLLRDPHVYLVGPPRVELGTNGL